MKKYIKVFVLSMAIILCMSVLVAYGCSKDSEEETIQLSAPSSLTIANKEASWSAVSNANGYEIKLGNDVRPVSGTNFDLSTLSLADGTYQVSVKAIGQTVGDIKYTDSAFSSPVEFIVNSMDGKYELVALSLNGHAYNFTNDAEMRDFMRLFTIELQKAMFAELGVFDVNNLNSIKNFFNTYLPGEYNFVGINTVEEFWNYFYDANMTEEDINGAINDLRSTFFIIENNKMSSNDASSSTYTMNGNTIVLSNPSAMGMEDTVVTYENGKITLLDDFDVIVMETIFSR